MCVCGPKGTGIEMAAIDAKIATTRRMNEKRRMNDHSRGFDDAIVVLRILTFYFVVDS